MRPIWLVLGLGGTLAVARPAVGQYVRISGATTVRYLDARPMEEDSIPASASRGTGLLRRSDEGFVVRCVTGDPFCRFRRPGGREAALPAVQDLTVSAWGFGRGVRAYGRFRGRTMIAGDDLLWPRSDDLFDALTAYVEVDRELFRARIGRQWTTGLGFRNYDGGSVLVRPLRQLRVEAFGGRSLAGNVNEPIDSDEIVTFESLAPDEPAYVLGAKVALRPIPQASFSAMYRREIRTDRLGLYSERVGLDARVRTGRGAVDGTLQVDWATNTVNEGRIRVWLPPFKDVTVNVFGRHHRPFFELWTIWGAFSPFGFDDFGVRADWRPPGGNLSITGWGSARWYTEDDEQPLFGDLRSQGWRLGAALSSRLGPLWNLDARYNADIGFGASGADGSLRLRRGNERGNFVAFNLAAFERVYELRLDEGTVLMAGLDGGFRVTEKARMVASVAAYSHTGTGQTPSVDWTQVRGYVRFEWLLGNEPELPWGGSGR